MQLPLKMDSKLQAALFRKKRKYGKLSLDQKVQIIRAAEMGYSQRTLASQYNCGKTQVHLLVTQKDLWLAKWERSRKAGHHSRARGSASISEINSLVWDFYKKATSHDMQVSSNMILERAKQIAQALNAPNFDAGHEWLERFKNEFNLNLSLTSSESLSNRIGDLADPLLKGRVVADVYYLGTLELYYRTLPCIGQRSQDHITVCFCISPSGEKEIIGIVFCENASVEGELWNVHVPCFSSPMGQITLEVYQHSLNVLNQKMSQLDRKILMYVDGGQFPSEIERTMSNIEISAGPWPFNVQEVINNYRLLYCQRLMTSLAASDLDHWSNLGQKAKSLPLSKVMKLVQSAWKEVSSKLVQLCFKSETDMTDRDSKCQEINTELLEEIQKLVSLFKSSNEDSSLCHTDEVPNIADEIFFQEAPEKNKKEIEQECCSGVSDNQEHNNLVDEEAAMTVLSRSDVVPTLLKLEIFLQSLPENSKRQEALDILDSLERSVQGLLISEEALDISA